MKHTALIVTLLSLSTLTHAEGDSKTIQVDETKFSDVYPAVWFSPSTGEIAPLKEKSETPPEKKYEIWIEPSDPEFGYNPDKKPVDVGFVLIGRGPEVFKSPKIPTQLNLKLKITHLMEERQAHEQFVFFCKAKTSTCLIMVTSMDSKEQVIRFKWRLLTQKKDVSNKAPGDAVTRAPQCCGSHETNGTHETNG